MPLLSFQLTKFENAIVEYALRISGHQNLGSSFTTFTFSLHSSTGHESLQPLPCHLFGSLFSYQALLLLLSATFPANFQLATTPSGLPRHLCPTPEAPSSIALPRTLMRDSVLLHHLMHHLVWCAWWGVWAAHWLLFHLLSLLDHFLLLFGHRWSFLILQFSSHSSQVY